jgi:hypothetical protein
MICPDNRHRRLLRRRRERPSRRRAAEQSDEFAPLHLAIPKERQEHVTSGAEDTTSRHGGLGSWSEARASALPR